MEETGFETDCKTLIASFMATGKMSFQAFSTEWMNHKFYYIFYGFSGTIDVIEFTDMCLPVAKRLFVGADQFPERLGAFYLLYTLYFKQPVREFTKIRMTVAEWVVMKEFYAEICKSDEYVQAKMIFLKLIQRQAFKFVVYDQECALSEYMNRPEADPQCSSGIEEHIGGPAKDIMNFVNEKQGVVSAIQLLEMGYNEMKEGLTDPRNAKLLPQSTCSADILKGLQQIQDIFNPIPPAEGGTNGDSRRKTLKKKAAYNNSDKSPEKIVKKTQSTTLWKKVVKVNTEELEITSPDLDMNKPHKSVAQKIFSPGVDDYDATTDDDNVPREKVEQILPDIS